MITIIVHFKSGESETFTECQDLPAALETLAMYVSDSAVSGTITCDYQTVLTMDLTGLTE